MPLNLKIATLVDNYLPPDGVIYGARESQRIKLNQEIFNLITEHAKQQSIQFGRTLLKNQKMKLTKTNNEVKIEGYEQYNVDLSTVITHAGESKTIAEWIGVWDANEYKDIDFDDDAYETIGEDVAWVDGYEKGFNRALSLTSKKEFDETDIRIIRNKLVDMCPKGDVTVADLEKHIKDHTNWTDEFMRSKLRPNSWEVEVEKERVEYFKNEHDNGSEWLPKITAGTIKVTNIKL